MGRKAKIFPGFASSPLFFRCTDGQGPGTDGIVLEPRFGHSQGGGFDKRTSPVSVVGQGLVYSADNPLFYLRIHCIPHDGLQVRGLWAAFWEDETLLVWIQLPKSLS